MAEVGGGGEVGRGREIIYLSPLHCHHQNALRWSATRAILMFQ